jgi:hypothetical protein
VRLLPWLGALALVAVSSEARAGDIEQGNQLTFGVAGAWVPAQNDLDADVAAVGPYVAFAHDLDFVYLGARFAALYGWLPGGGAGQQYLLEPEGFLGARLRVGPVRSGRRMLGLRLELGAGPLVNGGEGFPTAIVGRLGIRAGVQVDLVKSATIEILAGPTLTIGSYTVGVFPAIGLGGGWTF